MDKGVAASGSPDDVVQVDAAVHEVSLAVVVRVADRHSRGAVVRVADHHLPDEAMAAVPPQADQSVPWRVARNVFQRRGGHDSRDSKVSIVGPARRVVDLDHRVVPDQQVMVPIAVRVHMDTITDPLVVRAALVAGVLVEAQACKVARTDTAADLRVAANEVDCNVC